MAAPAFARVVGREFHIFRRQWHGSIFSSLVSPLLFLGAIGIGLGGLVEAESGRVDGLEYLDFVTPGMLAAAAMQTGAGFALWPVLGGIKWMRTYHAIVTTPISPANVYTGVVMWSGIRTALYATGFLVVATLLGGVPSLWGFAAVPAAALCGAAFAAPLAAFTATQDTDAAFPIIMRIVVMPLFLFSGTFFPVETLPDALEGLAVVSPLWHGVELCRGATTGSIEFTAAVGHTAALFACAAAGFAWGRATFTRRLTP